MVATTTTLTTQPVRYRNLQAAREAFSCPDESVSRNLSREAHGLLSTPAADEPSSPSLQPTWSPFLAASEAGHNEELAHKGAALLLGGAVDGIVLSLLVLSLGDAAGWPMALTAKLHAAILLCWVAYAGCREAVDSLTYQAYYKRERRREAWELENFPEGEVEEMVQLYSKRGLPEHAARTVVNAMASSPDFFVDVMMLEELQMSPPPAISAAAAAVRIAIGTLMSGGALLVVAALAGSAFSASTLSPTTTAASPPPLWHFSASYLVIVALAGFALCYLGSQRAAITHQERRKLAVQTCALALPCVLLARVAGSFLLLHGA